VATIHRPPCGFGCRIPFTWTALQRIPPFAALELVASPHTCIQVYHYVITTPRSTLCAAWHFLRTAFSGTLAPRTDYPPTPPTHPLPHPAFPLPRRVEQHTVATTFPPPHPSRHFAALRCAPHARTFTHAHTLHAAHCLPSQPCRALPRVSPFASVHFSGSPAAPHHRCAHYHISMTPVPNAFRFAFSGTITWFVRWTVLRRTSGACGSFQTVFPV